MGKKYDFKTARLAKGVQKIWSDYQNKSNEDIMTETYQSNVYYYACGQSGVEHLGWIKGVEYMMEYIGIDYTLLKEEVLERIEQEGRRIVNPEIFE